MTAEAGEAPRRAWIRDCEWWRFCFFIFALKFVLLALDPSPKLFLGDSASYVWTAVSGWIPADRSFSYGFIIHWLCSAGQSLTPLLLCQAFLGGATAILVAIICRSSFGLSLRASYVFGFVSAIDPLQLLWERYVMTEVISLFFYAILLFLSFLYLRDRRLWCLILIQFLGVLVISLRISYLLLLEAQTVLLPLIAYFPELGARFRDATYWPSIKRCGVHLIVSIALLLLLHSGYKRLNGRLSAREPAYVYVTGLNLLAMWSPTIEPADAPDPRLANLIAEAAKSGIKDPGARGLQLYRSGYLIDRWKHTEKNLTKADRLAKETAMHALLRNPFGVARLGWQTFLGYFHPERMRRQAKYELGNIRLPESLRSQLVRFFHYSPPPESVAAKHSSMLQKYFLNSQPYHDLVVLVPFMCLLLMFLFPRRSVLLLFLHSGILLGTSVLFTVTATVRYLQPLSLLTILTAAAAWEWRVARRADSAAAAKAASNA
jgi:hypothetical protein